jgi:hypothetical protein
MTPNQIEIPSKQTKSTRSPHRVKYLLLLLVILLGCLALTPMVSSHFSMFTYKSTSTAPSSLVMFEGPGAAYRFQYDPSLFQHVAPPHKNGPQTFEAKVGHASFTIATSPLLPWAFIQIYSQDEAAYHAKYPSLYCTQSSFRPNIFMLTFRTFSVHNNHYYVENAVLNGHTVSKLRIQYDSGCDAACSSALTQTASSFLVSSPH